MQRLCTNRHSTESRNFSKLLHVNILNASRILFKYLLKFIKMLMMNMHATNFRTASQKIVFHVEMQKANDHMEKG